MTIENMIYETLKVDDNIKKEDYIFLVNNKLKLTKIFEMESSFYEIPIFFEDGIVKTNDKIFQQSIDEINKANKIFKNDENFLNVINYINNNIFENQDFSCQELIINKKDSILALCDLSSKKSILEIKTSSPILNEKKYFEKLKYQLYYQSNNRKIYLMTIEFFEKETIINF